MYDVYLSSLEKCIYHVHYEHVYPRFVVEDFDMMLVIPDLRLYYTIRGYVEKYLLISILKFNLSILETVEVSRLKDEILRLSIKSSILHVSSILISQIIVATMLLLQMST